MLDFSFCSPARAQSQVNTHSIGLVGKYRKVAMIATDNLGRNTHPSQNNTPAKGMKQIPDSNIVILGNINIAIMNSIE